MFEKPLKLYILARLDLTCSQRAVQTCHELATLMLRNATDPQLRAWASDHHTLIILGVDGEAELCRWEDELCARQIVCEHFREPDLKNQKTALAVHPTTDGRLFRKLPLL